MQQPPLGENTAEWPPVSPRAPRPAPWSGTRAPAGTASAPSKYCCVYMQDVCRALRDRNGRCWVVTLQGSKCSQPPGPSERGLCPSEHWGGSHHCRGGESQWRNGGSELWREEVAELRVCVLRGAVCAHGYRSRICVPASVRKCMCKRVLGPVCAHGSVCVCLHEHLRARCLCWLCVCAPVARLLQPCVRMCLPPGPPAR